MIALMRVLLFLTVFYSALIAYGMNVSYAERGGACSDAQCIEKQLASDIQNEEELITQIQDILKKIETKVSKEKLHAIIQGAVDKNPQAAELLKIIQQYGVLTDIQLNKKETP